MGHARARVRRDAAEKDDEGADKENGQGREEEIAQVSDIVAGEVERVLARPSALSLRALPDHAGKALQRHQRLAGIGPFLQFLDGDVIERLASGAAREQRARDVDHMRRARAFVKQRRAACGAEAARSLRRKILVAPDQGLALDDAKALAPAADIGGVGRAMRAPARCRMIVPGPARRHVDLEGDLAAQALAGCDSGGDSWFGHAGSPCNSSLRAKRSNPFRRKKEDGLLRRGVYHRAGPTGPDPLAPRNDELIYAGAIASQGRASCSQKRAMA